MRIDIRANAKYAIEKRRRNKTDRTPKKKKKLIHENECFLFDCSGFIGNIKKKAQNKNCSCLI